MYLRLEQKSHFIQILEHSSGEERMVMQMFVCYHGYSFLSEFLKHCSHFPRQWNKVNERKSGSQYNNLSLLLIYWS